MSLDDRQSQPPFSMLSGMLSRIVTSAIWPMLPLSCALSCHVLLLRVQQLQVAHRVSQQRRSCGAIWCN